jgi:hypothetical protein
MPIIYTSWGILNNFCLWEKMPYVEYDPSVLNAIQSSAYINIKKIPGRTSSPESVIKEAYLIHNDILHKQIEYYDPDIIIGGSTLHHFFQNLGFTGEQMERNGSNNYIIKDEKIFIDAYHPAQRPGTTGVSKESYCNDIITAVKNWSSN